MIAWLIALWTAFVVLALLIAVETHLGTFAFVAAVVLSRLIAWRNVRRLRR